MKKRSKIVREEDFEKHRIVVRRLGNRFYPIVTLIGDDVGIKLSLTCPTIMSAIFWAKMFIELHPQDKVKHAKRRRR